MCGQKIKELAQSVQLMWLNKWMSKMLIQMRLVGGIQVPDLVTIVSARET